MMLALLSIICVGGVTSHHILFVHTTGTKSHSIQMAPLAEELLARGHQVTGIFFNSLKLKHENYTEMVVPFDMDNIMKESSKLLMEKGGTNAYNPRLWLWAWQMWGDLLENSTRGVFENQGVNHLLESHQTVDVVITFMYSGSFFAEYFDCPIIQFSPAGPVPWLMQGTGNVFNPSTQLS